MSPWDDNTVAQKNDVDALIGAFAAELVDRLPALEAELATLKAIENPTADEVEAIAALEELIDWIKRNVDVTPTTQGVIDAANALFNEDGSLATGVTKDDLTAAQTALTGVQNNPSNTNAQETAIDNLLTAIGTAITAIEAAEDLEAAIEAAQEALAEYWDDVPEQVQAETAVANAYAALSTAIAEATATTIHDMWTGTALGGGLYTNLVNAVESFTTQLPLADDGVITLEYDITLDGAVELNGATEIDLAGNDIIIKPSDETITNAGAVFTAITANGELTITGPGTISVDADKDDLGNTRVYVLRVEGGGDVTIGEGVVLQATEDDNGSYYLSSAVVLASSAQDSELNVYGTVSGGAGITMDGTVATGSQVVNIYDGAQVGGAGWAIYDGGNGANVLNVYGGEILGGSGGIQICGGELNVYGGTIGTGSIWEPGTGASGASSGRGAAISVRSYGNRDTIVTIKGGELLGGTKLVLNVRDTVQSPFNPGSGTVQVTYDKDLVGKDIEVIQPESGNYEWNGDIDPITDLVVYTLETKA